MPKVTFSNSRGILQEAGTGFQVNDAPILEEIEAVVDSAVFSVTVNASGDTAGDLQNKYFYIADASDSQWYVWMNVNTDGVEGGEGVDPDPDAGDTTGIEVAVEIGDTAAAVATAIAAAINTENATEFTATAADAVVTVSCLEVGNIVMDVGNDLVTIGNLTNLGVDSSDPLDGIGDEEFLVELVSNGSGNSALATFGVTNLTQDNDQNVVGTAGLAATTAGTKKLLHASSIEAGSSVVVTYINGVGGSSTLTFDTTTEWAYLLSNGTGWVELGKAAGV
jgi:hypothetical protein